MDIVTSLILSNNLQFDEGEIKLLGTNICLIPPKVYLFLFNELQKRGEQKIIYQTCKASAKNWFTNLAKSSGKIKREDLFNFLPKILNLLSYGKASILENNQTNKLLRVRLDHSLYPELNGKSDFPIDVGFAGYLAGATSVIYSTNMVCSEIRCTSQGEQYCEFEVKPGDD